MDGSQRDTRLQPNSVSYHDLFATDPFWDRWDKPDASFGGNSDEEEGIGFQEDFADCDWGDSSSKRAADHQAKLKRREEYYNKLSADTAATIARIKKKEEADAKEAAEAKAAADAAAELLEQRRTDATLWADQEVKHAFDCIALAKPVEALSILASASVNEEFDHLNIDDQYRIAQIYDALEKHQALQKTLALV